VALKGAMQSFYSRQFDTHICRESRIIMSLQESGIGVSICLKAMIEVLIDGVVNKGPNEEIIGKEKKVDKARL
jgi:hypothetical protein